MGYEIKGLKFHRGHEGEPLAQCTLYRDEKRIALYSDADWGGENQFDWLDCGKDKVAVETTNYAGKPWTMRCTPEEALLLKHVEGMVYDSTLSSGEPLALGMDGFVGTLIDEFELRKGLKKRTKKWFMFRLCSEEYAEGAFTYIASPTTPEKLEQIKNKHGSNLKSYVDASGQWIHMDTAESEVVMNVDAAEPEFVDV